MCTLCHDDATVEKFQTYHVKLRAAVPELQSGVMRLREALRSAKVSPQRSAALAVELGEVQRELDFLRAANDVHNMHYAVKLLESLVDHVTAIARELKVPAPNVALPPPLAKP
jgi:hypothetical protein